MERSLYNPFRGWIHQSAAFLENVHNHRSHPMSHRRGYEEYSSWLLLQCKTFLCIHVCKLLSNKTKYTNKKINKVEHTNWHSRCKNNMSRELKGDSTYARLRETENFGGGGANRLLRRTWCSSLYMPQAIDSRGHTLCSPHHDTGDGPYWV